MSLHPQLIKVVNDGWLQADFRPANVQVTEQQ